EARASFAAWIERRANALQQVTRERQVAVAAASEQAVRDYEEIRKRRSAATESVERMAYELAERAKRSGFESYARVLDDVNQSPKPLPFVVLASDASNERLIIAVPIAPADLNTDDLRWRVAACLFDAAEKAAREMNSVVAVGTTFGSLAVEL